MYKKTIATIFITSSLVANPIFASNIFQKLTSAQPTKKTSTALKVNSGLKTKDGVNTFIDFSGTWVGECDDFEGTETFTIKNSDFDFTVDEQHFLIGALETVSTSNELDTNFSHTLLEWNADHSNLLMNGSFVNYTHMQEIKQKEFGYLNGTISLKNDQLIIEVNSQSSAKNDNTVCTYSKQ